MSFKDMTALTNQIPAQDLAVLLVSMQSIQNRLTEILLTKKPLFQHVIIIWAVALNDQTKFSPINACELSRRYTLGSPATVNRYLADLSQLITLRPDSSDRRIKWLSLSQEGWNFLGDVERDMRKLVQWEISTSVIQSAEQEQDLDWIQTSRIKEILYPCKVDTKAS